jgi:hypothetical protein
MGIITLIFINPKLSCLKGECTTDLCHNGGTCISNIGNYTCACADGYTGNTCEGKYLKYT